MRDVKFAHFTVTDVQNNAFHAAAKTSRGSFGEAGFEDGDRLVWIEDWEIDLQNGFHLKAAQPDYAIDLEAKPERPPIFQGNNGYSQKAAGEGHASIYYSIPRLATSGRVRVGSKNFEVHGVSWFDREWATNQLAPDQIGWNWFALHFSDGSDLMLYQMRLKDGGFDPSSNGKLARPDGSEVSLRSEDFQLAPLQTWKSPVTKADYPIKWRLRIPGLQLSADVTALVQNQELNVGVQYWEGCVGLEGEIGGHAVQGNGYLEMTGYHEAVGGIGSGQR